MEMNQKQLVYRQITFLGVVLSLTTFTVLAFLILFTLPSLGFRWLFFFLFMVAICSASIPFIVIFHRRFPSNPPAEIYVVIRQAVWFGIYGDLLAWMQLGRVLDFNRAFLLAIGFIVIEILLRLLERSHWQPKGSENGPVE